MNSTISRRELLEAGAMAGVGLAFGGRALAANTSTLPLITKAIPATGERIPVIGVGTIWYRDAQFEQLREVLQRMSELGGTVIDTAAAYGESEGVIGRALAELKRRNKMFIATKFDAGGAIPMLASAAPPPGVSQPNSSSTQIPGPPVGVTRPERDGVAGQASFERSLQRLQTDHVDLLQVHGMNGIESLLPLMVDWKKAKKIRYIGVTTSSPQQHESVIEAMRTYPLDFIQVDYSIGNRGAAEAVLPVAIERRVAVLANLPLGRATLLQKMAGRELPKWAAEVGISSWSQFLLKYVVSHPAVTCAIPGMTKVEHLVDNFNACRGSLPDTAMRKRMEEFWDASVG